MNRYVSMIMQLRIQGKVQPDDFISIILKTLGNDKVKRPGLGITTLKEYTKNTIVSLRYPATFWLQLVRAIILACERGMQPYLEWPTRS